MSTANVESSELLYADVQVRPIVDGEYFALARDLIQGTTRFALCSLFIVDHGERGHAFEAVDHLLTELASANWRGVDTRLVIGGSRENHRIRSSALLATARAKELGISTRLASALRHVNTHMKLMIVDDRALIGSHNWASGMLGGQIQDSILVESAELASGLIALFQSHWDESASEQYDVSL